MSTNLHVDFYSKFRQSTYISSQKIELEIQLYFLTNLSSKENQPIILRPLL